VEKVDFSSGSKSSTNLFVPEQIMKKPFIDGIFETEDLILYLQFKNNKLVEKSAQEIEKLWFNSLERVVTIKIDRLDDISTADEYDFYSDGDYRFSDITLESFLEHDSYLEPEYDWSERIIIEDEEVEEFE
jgi:hypothetical protein